MFALGAGAALAQDVNVNYVPGTDFTKLQDLQVGRDPGRREARPDSGHPDQTGHRQGAGGQGAGKGGGRHGRPGHRLPGGPDSAAAVEHLQHGRLRGPAVRRRHGHRHQHHDQHRHGRPRHARRRGEGTGVEGAGEQDGEQREGPREAAEEHRQGDGEAPQGLPAEAEEVTGTPPGLVLGFGFRF
ncbi:MAG: hypothetical protein MZV64_04950 [Ignavibacteriales bacterium]|nr:hypothetical protein [Ignavibacteriales bacterium]